MPKTNNFYIHGTSSATLASVFLTDNTLKSALQVTLDYGIGPFAGEITLGGYCGADCDLAFGRVRSERGSNYDLGKVVDGYAKMHDTLPTIEKTKKLIAQYLKGSDENMLRDFRVIIVLLGRLRALSIAQGKTVEFDAYKIEVMATIKSAYENMEDMLYIIALLPYLTPTEALKKDCPQDWRAYEFLSNPIGSKAFFKKIQEAGLKFKEIYNSPKQENLEKLRALFDFELAMPSRELETLVHRCFNIKPEMIGKMPQKIIGTENADQEAIITMSLRKRLGIHANWAEHIAEHIEGHALNINEPFYLREIAMEYLNTYKGYMDKFSTCFDKQKEFSEQEQRLIDNPFPIVFLCAEEGKLSSVKGEFRANKPFVLGEDITAIGTNSLTNMRRLKGALEARNLFNVRVIHLDALEVHAQIKSISLKDSALQLISSTKEALQNYLSSRPSTGLRGWLRSVAEFIFQLMPWKKKAKLAQEVLGEVNKLDIIGGDLDKVSQEMKAKCVDLELENGALRTNTTLAWRFRSGALSKKITKAVVLADTLALKAHESKPSIA